MAGENFYNKLSTKILNAGTALQKGDRFRVRFLGIPENLSDFLSRQVRSITPRTISFGELRHSNRRAQFNDVGKIEQEPLVLTLVNDDQQIAQSIIMAQVFRQKGNDISGFPKVEGVVDGYKFSIKIEYLDLNGEVSSHEHYKKCFIRSVIPTDRMTTDDMPPTTTLSLSYDEVEYSFEEGSFAFTS